MCRRRGAGTQQTLPGFCSDLPPSWGEAGTTSCGDTALLLYSVSCKAGRVPSSLSLAATGGLGCTPFPAACDGAFRSAGACTGRPRSRVVTSSRTFSLSASSADTASSASADERRRGRGHAVDRLHRAAMLVVPVMTPPSLISRGRCPSLFVVGRTAAVRHGELLLAITAYCPSKLQRAASRGRASRATGCAPARQAAPPLTSVLRQLTRGCVCFARRVSPRSGCAVVRRAVCRQVRSAGAKCSSGVRPSDSHARATRASCPARRVARGVAHLGSRQPTGSPSCSAPAPTRADPSARRPPGWRPPGKAPAPPNALCVFAFAAAHPIVLRRGAIKSSAKMYGAARDADAPQRSARQAGFTRRTRVSSPSPSHPSMHQRPPARARTARSPRPRGRCCHARMRDGRWLLARERPCARMHPHATHSPSCRHQRRQWHQPPAAHLPRETTLRRSGRPVR